jgi:DNA-binding CsgD family transcriptional regulator
MRGELMAAAASPRISAAAVCKAHFERAGVSVPAVHFVGGEGYCAACFNGEPIARAQETLRELEQELPSRPARRPGVRAGTRISPGSLERARQRKTKIRDVAPPQKRREARPGDPLSPREREVLEILSAGSDSTAVAATSLGISNRTVKYFLERAFKKTGTHDRASLLLWFARTPGKPGDDPDGFVRDCLARIEQLLDLAYAAIDDRAARASRELASAAQTRERLARLERAFGVLKTLAGEAAEACPRKSASVDQ